MRLSPHTLTSSRYPRLGSGATFRASVRALVALVAAALLLVMPGRAEAAQPTVLTGAASALTQTTATLNATVNPEGEEVTECTLEYGTSIAYGSNAPCTPPPGLGTSPVAVSASVTGLTANTAYHFRISATNLGGTSKGSDHTFTTLPNPPAVETKAASAVAQTTATLNATVNPNGGEVSDCHFEYGTTISYGSSAACTSLPGSGESPVAVSGFIEEGLAPNTAYHFRISATNLGGTSKGSDQTFNTLPNPPTVITGAALAGTDSAILHATVNPNGTGVSRCEFQYGPTPSYGSSALCSSPPGSGTSSVAVFAALVGGLSANTAYHFRVVAANAGGTSYGADRTFTTMPTLKISLPGGGALGGVGSSEGGSPEGSGVVTSAQIAARLARQLTPSGKTAKIAALLKSGGYTVAFKAFEAGTVVIGWYYLPPGPGLARKAKPKLVASGKLTFLAAGTAKVKLKLTAAGKSLLKHANKLRLTAKGTFTPTGKAPVTAVRTFILKR